MEQEKHKVFIGIGSNIGDSAENCTRGIKMLAWDNRFRLVSTSSLYVTSPVSAIGQEDFVNCAICAMWDGTPFQLLVLINEIEERMGRRRTFKNAPRIIDLDILLFGDLIIDTPLLKIPHPEMHRRKFTIVPCLEIEPSIIHPVYRRALREFLQDIGDEQRIGLLKSPVFH